MYDKASIALIPSGYKAGSTDNLYSVLPANGDGDFNATRGSTATRVNKDGLIETVAADTPRLDYSVNADCPHLLLEPQSTNVIENSEVTSTWTYTEYGSGSAGTITTGKTDMFGGINAVQIDFPSDAENVSFTFGQTSSSISSGSVALSVYIKLVESDAKTLQFRASSNATSLINVNSTDFVRYEMTGTKNSSEAFNLKLRPSQGTSSGGFSIIICHPQEEVGSYSTSYIPTSGSAETRSADVCNSAGTSAEFNDSEGVLFAEIAALANDGTIRQMSLSNGTTSNRIVFQFNNITNQYRFFMISGGTTVQSNFYTISDITAFNKIAYKYEENNIKVYINGTQVITDTSATMPIGLDDLSFDAGNGANDLYGKVKQVIYFNEALSDSELQTLTS